MILIYINLSFILRTCRFHIGIGIIGNQQYRHIDTFFNISYRQSIPVPILPTWRNIDNIGISAKIPYRHILTLVRKTREAYGTISLVSQAQSSCFATIFTHIVYVRFKQWIYMTEFELKCHWEKVINN